MAKHVRRRTRNLLATLRHTLTRDALRQLQDRLTDETSLVADLLVDLVEARRASTPDGLVEAMAHAFERLAEIDRVLHAELTDAIPDCRPSILEAKELQPGDDAAFDDDDG